MRPPLTIAPSGPSEWTAYRGQDLNAPIGTIRAHPSGLASVQRAPEEPAYGAQPEWTALFWSLPDATCAFLAYGADLWRALDPTPAFPGERRSAT